VSYLHYLTFGKEEYQYDDRAYMLLPGYPANNLLPWRQHRKTMGRLLYQIVSMLGIVQDVAPFVLDSQKFKDMYIKSTRNYRNLWKKK